MKFSTFVNMARAMTLFTVLLLLYIGNLAAGWPVDWWVPAWFVFTVDAAAAGLGFAFGGSFGASQLNAAEAYGKFQKERNNG